MKITDVRDALVLTGIPTYHFYAADPKPERYIIWGETSAASALSADDEIIILKPRGEIWFYTTDEYDEGIAEICEALNGAGIPFSIVNIGRDTVLRQIVYQISWEIECGGCDIY